jgi:glycine cleavage system H protein
VNVPEDLMYTVEHEWIKSLDNGRVRIGITDYAQDQLGDVVYVDLPDVGREVGKDDLIAEIESTKSVGEVYAPFGGVVAAVNEAVSETPELVNTSPYVDGWLVEMTFEGEMPEGDMLDAGAYRNLTE